MAGKEDPPDTGATSQAAGDAGQAAAFLTAQSAAIALQDATNALRNATTIAAAASGAALGRFLATGDSRFLDALPASRKLIEEAIADFTTIASASVTIVGREDQAGRRREG